MGIFAQISKSNEIKQRASAYRMYAKESRSIYDSLLYSWNDGSALKDANNLAGNLAWGESYVMESFLEMYEATQDTSYLLLFIDHADAVYNSRDDKSGLEDWRGVTDIGWLTNGPFTLGKPIVIPDSSGSASIELQAIRYGNNHKTYFSIEHQDAVNTFSIKVWNDRIGKNILFPDLSIENIEEKINNSLSPSSLIKARIIGKNIPIEVKSEQFKTYKIRLKSFHTPLICSPFAQFAYIIQKYHLFSFNRKAVQYLQFAEECANSYIDLWVEDNSTGYFMVDRSIAYWMSNLPVPHNVLSANGTFYLYLYLSTNNSLYKNILQKLAIKIQSGLRKESSGKIVMDYAYGATYRGWNDTNRFIYENYLGSKHIEDNSHFSITTRFIVSAKNNLNLFDDAVLEDLVYIFNTSYNNGKISFKIDGTGYRPKSNESAGSYSLLGQLDSLIYKNCYNIYKKQYSQTKTGVVLLGWAQLTRMAGQLASIPESN